jgi:transcriptional regulator with PAS, ATPase and Fis domain
MGEALVRPVDVRIVCATNANLAEKVRAGTFREDLYYRVNVVHIRIPALRERSQDVHDFIVFYFRRRNLPVPRLSPAALDLLNRYGWPGNMRELENELERMTAFHRDIQEISPSMLSDRIACGGEEEVLDFRMLDHCPLPDAVRYLEQRLLKKALARWDWNKTRAARALGLSRQGLLKKIKRYGIERGTFVVHEEDTKP